MQKKLNLNSDVCTLNEDYNIFDHEEENETPQNESNGEERSDKS